MAEEKIIGLDLSLASEEAIQMLIDDPADSGIFFEILHANRQRPAVLRLLYNHSGTPIEINHEVATLLSLPVKTTSVVKESLQEETEEARLQKTPGLLQRMQKLAVGDRIQLALRGGKEVRNILIRDPYKEVVMRVLENPKITESEVERIARNPSAPEDALRFIAKKRNWMRRYPVVYALVSNPKTPPGVSISFVSHLRLHDLIILEKNKNTPYAVREAAGRYIKMRKRA